MHTPSMHSSYPIHITSEGQLSQFSPDSITPFPHTACDRSGDDVDVVVVDVVVVEVDIVVVLLVVVTASS